MGWNWPLVAALRNMYKPTPPPPETPDPTVGIGAEVGDTIVSRRTELETHYCAQCRMVIQMYRLEHESSDPARPTWVTVECANGHEQS